MKKNAVIESARSWLGTAFRHQGRRKACGGDKGGVDCLGLLVGVAGECGMEVADAADYGHFPDEKRLYEGLRRYLAPVDAMQPGDVLLMRIDGHNRHLGIVGDYRGEGRGVRGEYLKAPTLTLPHEWGRGRVPPPIYGGRLGGGNAMSLIHAYAPARGVVEHRLDEAWLNKVVEVLRWE